MCPWESLRILRAMDFFLLRAVRGQDGLDLDERGIPDGVSSWFVLRGLFWLCAVVALLCLLA